MPKTKKSKYTWSNANIAEVLPGVNPPLFSSFIVEYFSPLFTRLLHEVTRYKFPKDTTLLREIKGHLYFNTTLLDEVLAELTMSNNISVAEVLGGEQKAQKDLFKKVPIWTKIKLFFSISTFSLYILLRHQFVKRKLLNLQAEIDKINSRVERTENLEELLALNQEIFENFKNWIFKTFSLAFGTLAAYPVFLNLCQKWLGDKNNHTANVLLSDGGDGFIDVDIFVELWDLGDLIRKNREVREKFLKTQNTVDALKILKSDSKISRRFNSFMASYGHRCDRELNFCVPRWSEDPTFIIDVLKNYLKSPVSNNPHKKIRQLKKRQKLIMQKISEELSRWRFYIFKKFLRGSRHGLLLREEYKCRVVKYMVPIRTTLLKIGRKLQKLGFLGEPEDIFMLTVREMGQLSENKNLDKKFFAVLKKRKNEYQKYEKMNLPAVIRDGEKIRFSSKTVVPKGGILKGVAASHGKVDGIARVILSVSEIDELKPGEILVTERTDPSWTPIFATIKGVITNTGGILSHASVVAREYGLPAVVNVKDATRIIKTGKHVILDGDRGVVKIIK